MAMFAAILAATFGIGCRKSSSSTTTDDTSTLAQDGTDTSFAESDSELLSSSLVGSSATGSLTLADADVLDNGDLQTDNIGDGAKGFFFPRGCLTVVNDSVGQVATYDFNGCTGPFGLLRITGNLKATYSSTANSLTLDLVGTNLTVNRANVDWHAHAVITSSGTSRTMTWSAQLSGTTARSRQFTRTNTKTVTWKVGERCFTLNGTSDGDVTGREIKTEIVNYSRCAAACPEAGGEITITNVKTGTKLEITYDGSNTATFTGPQGTASIPLICAG
jgi:hypothetical protein